MSFVFPTMQRTWLRKLRTDWTPHGNSRVNFKFKVQSKFVATVAGISDYLMTASHLRFSCLLFAFRVWCVNPIVFLNNLWSSVVRGTTSVCTSVAICLYRQHQTRHFYTTCRRRRWWGRTSRPLMSVGILGTNCDQCLNMVQCCFTSTETVRLIRPECPGRPPRLSHSSWTLIGVEKWVYNFKHV